MEERSWKLVAANEPTAVAKPFFDAFVVENG
jgi:hypothetical protein